MIIAPKDYIGILGICECGSDVADYLCNEDLQAVRPEGITWDWWASCTNPRCSHHYGEGTFQDQVSWVVYRVN